VIFLSLNRYTDHHLVSTGSLSASVGHPARCWGRPS
jgi:hypothetical protein